MIAMTDYWIDANPIDRFIEFALPMAVTKPVRMLSVSTILYNITWVRGFFKQLR